MTMAIGSRVTVEWSDGKVYTGTLVGANAEWLAVRFDGDGEPQWAPAEKVTLVHLPIGAQVTVRHEDKARIGSVVAGDRERTLVRWAAKRERAWVKNDDVVHVGGVSAANAAFEAMGLGLATPGASIDPRQPPTKKARASYRAGDRVWAKAPEDGWWYEARVVAVPAEGAALYRVEWADGCGAADVALEALRAR